MRDAMLSLVERVVDSVLTRAAATISRLPRNDHLWSYTIAGDYMTRVMLPRVAGVRLLIHKIHRHDADRHLHNHPWRWAYSLVLTGGYVEERLGEPDCPLSSQRGPTVVVRRPPGSIGRLRRQDFHRIESVARPCWTLFLAGPRVDVPDHRAWGFLVRGRVVPWTEYLGVTRTEKEGPSS